MKAKRSFKKILVICFILTLLSNYLLILNDIGHAVYAVNWDVKEPTASIDTHTTNDETKENQVVDNENQNKAQETNTVQENSESNNEISEDFDVKDRTNILQNQEDSENTVDNNTVQEDEKNEPEEIKVLDDLEASAELKLDRLIKYDNAKGKGVLLETTFKVMLNKTQNEVTSMLVELDVPKPSDKLPVYLNLENKDENTNWNYDTESGKLEIEVSEINSEEEISKEYKIQYIYGAETYDLTDFSIKGNLIAKHDEEIMAKEITAQIEEIKETSENYAEYSSTAVNSSIYKGYLNANIISSLKYDTPYDTINTVKVNNSEYINSIEIENAKDKFITNDGKEFSLINNIRYVKTTISKEEFDSILGEEGYVEIYTAKGELIATINKNSELQGDLYTYIYEGDISEVTFKIVNPVKNGTLSIKNQKAVLSSNIFSNEQVRSFAYIESTGTGRSIKNVGEKEVAIQSIQFSNKIELQETESKMTMSLNNENLSTEIENDVTINVTLKTNEEKYELFKNPSVEIEFPYSVEEVDVKSVNLLYKNGLSITDWKVVDNTVGEKVIKIDLSGSQLEYTPGMMIEGTQIVIYAKVKVNKLTANGLSNIKLKYKNEASTRISYALEGKESENVEINYVSRSGLLKATTLENFNNNLDTIFNFNEETTIGKLDINSTEKISKMSMTVLNNHSNDISDVYIIGKIPSVGNTDENGKDLNTNVDTYLKRVVTVNGLISKVYYSEKVNPQKDDQSWVENPEDITKIKSYKIVIQSGIIKKGESISFDYDLAIPEGLEFNQQANAIYSIYYNLNGEQVVESSIVGMETEVKEISLQDCQTTEEVTEQALAIGTQVTLAGKTITEEDKVHNGQILRYNIVVTNQSQAPITNIKLKGTAQNANMYWWKTYKIISSSTGEEATTGDWVEDKDGTHSVEEFTIDSLNPGETKNVSYQIVVDKKVESENSTVFGNIEVTADGIETSNIETVKNEIKNADLRLIVKSGIQEDVRSLELASNSAYRIHTDVKNTSGRVLENVIVSVELPKCMTVDKDLTDIIYETEYELEQNINSNIVHIHVDRIEIGEEQTLGLFINIEDIELEKAAEKVSIIATSDINGESYISNDYIRTIKQTRTAFSANYTSNRENGSTVSNSDDIVYRLDVVNEGIVDSYVKVIDSLPYGINISSINIINQDGTIKTLENTKFIYEDLFIKSKEKVSIEIAGKVDIYDCRTDQEYIANIFEIEGDLINSKIEEISFKIAYPEGWVKEEETTDELEDENLFDESDSVVEEEPKEEVPEEKEPELPEDNKQEENKQPEKDEDKEENPPAEETKPENKEPEVQQPTQDKELNEENKEPEKNEKQEVPSQSEQSKPENTNKPQVVTKKKYSISGFVWYDQNKNGIYAQEELAKDIEVMLYRSNTNSSINKSDLVKSVKTNEEGKYTFNDVEEDSYVIVFKYDNSLYNITKYKASEGLSVNRSYGIEKTLTIDGKQSIYGVSDVIVLNNNKSNINLGLVNKNEFDMSIKTFVNSVTIETSKETKTEKFEGEENLNKVEIASKYIDGAKVTVKYKVKVTNNGNLEGFVNQIIDTIPEGFEFDSNLNKNWTKGQDGKLYNSSLSNIKIAAGESKELTLTLVKVMYGKSTGTFKNEAHIVDSTNSLQIKDNNSKNDSSSVELIVSIKTGAVTYISLIIGIIAICTLIIILVNKNILKDKKEIRKNLIIILLSMLVLVLFIGIINNVYAGSGTTGSPWEWYDDIIDSGIDTFLSKGFKKGHYVNYVDSTVLSERKSMCIEGGNIGSTVSENSGDFKIFGETHIKTNSKNNYKQTGDSNFSSNDVAAFLGYIGYGTQSVNYTGVCDIPYHGCSQWTQYKNIIGYCVDNNLKVSGIKTVLGLSSLSKSASATYQDMCSPGLYSEANTYQTFWANNKDNLSVSNAGGNTTVTSTEISSTSVIGPFTAKYPKYVSGSEEEKKVAKNTNLLQYKVSGGSWTTFTGTINVRKSNGNTVTVTNGVIPSDLYNTKFYIPSSKIPENTVKIRIKNTHYSYETRAIYITNYKTGGQHQMVIRGKRFESSSNTEWNVDDKCEVQIDKFVRQYKNGSDTIKLYGADSVSWRKGKTNTQKSNDKVVVEPGDYVVFTVSVKNIKNAISYVRFTDTYDANKLQLVEFRQTGSSYSWNTNLATNATSGNWKIHSISSGSISLKYDANIAKGNNASVYLKFKVKTNSASSIDITNKADISAVKNSSGTVVYSSTVNNLESSSILTSSEYLKTKIYSISINKYITNIDGTAISGRSTSKTTQLYAEPGQTVTYNIEVKNTGTNSTSYGNLKTIKFTDTFTSSYLTLDTSKVILPSGWSRSGNTFTYTGNLTPGASAGVISLTYNITKASTSNTEITNTAAISYITNKNGYVLYNSSTNYMKGTLTSSDKFKLKKYSASINKYIVNIDGSSISGRNTNKSTQMYAETGEYVVFAITITNTGTSTTTDGNIKNISFTDTLTNGSYVSFAGYSTSATGTFSNTAPTGWTISGSTFTYTNEIAPKGTATIYLKYNVTGTDKTNKQITNTVKITNIKNKKGFELYSGTNFVNGSSFTSSDNFKLKIYSVNVVKDVLKVNSTTVSTQNGITCEVGDTITFKITVTNNGNSTTHGKFKSINLTDILNPNDLLEYSNPSQTAFGDWTKNGNVFTYTKDLNPGASSSFEITMKVVKNNTSDTLVTNTATIISQVTNKKGIDIYSVLNGDLSDDAQLTVLSYHLEVSKYITRRITPTSNETFTSRNTKDNTQKYNDPVEVEKYDTVEYTITVKNSGATNFNKISLQDILESGINFDSVQIKTAKKYVSDSDTSGTNANSKIAAATTGNTKNIIYSDVLKPNERLVITFECEITKTNLYLLNLKNTLNITEVLNKNNEAITFTLDKNDNEDYVRLKDLIISGTVWEDTNKNGVMDSTEPKLNGIPVTLHDVTNKKKVTTATDGNGYYIFPATEDMVSEEGRVVKATNKDKNTGNYSSASQYINYYVEFEYNGVTHKSTIYSDNKNIKADGSYKTEYLTDSNAAEFTDVRETFKNKLETISLNKGQGSAGDIELEYAKSGHTSTINKTDKTTMKAQSFINSSQPGIDGIQSGDIKYLWLYHDGETEYLKYINLGLQTQSVDLSLTKDVYEVKTTINGEQMTYEYNQHDVSGSEYSGKYVTGGEGSEKAYKFNIYRSDYFYHHTQYSKQPVITYKENTELNVEVTYKMKITNEKVDSDQPDVYAVIKEIADHYSTNFVEFGSPNKTIKIKDAEGFLQNQTVNIAEAWINESGTRKDLVLSNSKQYGEEKSFSNYHNVYITGLNDVKLKQGESVEVYVKFVVALNTGNRDLTETEIENIKGCLKVGETNNIAEINAYSVYEPDNTPAGYVDKDSNPGNLENTNGIENYEDDTFKAKLELKVNGSADDERFITGMVWDDARSEVTEGQYHGNGNNTTGSTTDTRNGNASFNDKVDGDETHDTAVQGATANIVELVSIKQSDNTIRTYEESIETWDGAIITDDTDSDGKYALQSFIPGTYITVFEYGESKSDDYKEKIINMLIFNGQDYKSTKYEEVGSVTGDDLVNKLTESGKSDARDDEIRRLEVMSFSEIMNNAKSELLQISPEELELLKNKLNGALTTTEKQKIKDALEAFVEATKMNAETVAFPIRPEDSFKSDLSNEQKEKMKNEYKVTFDTYNKIMGRTIRYDVNNIDFGIEYRPETRLELEKRISEVKVTLSSGEVLADIIFQYVSDLNGDGKLDAEIDATKSIGEENLQHLPTVGDVQGFAYLNVDMDLLQGATVNINYDFFARNLSEIDRISPILNSLRYKQNPAASALATTGSYTASGVSRNVLYNQVFGTDENGITYRKINKTYGTYLGSMYYTGVKGTDVISSTKIDKILDYVDNDLTFNINENKGTDNFWTTTTSEELKIGGFVKDSAFTEIIEAGTSTHKLLDRIGVMYDTIDRDDASVHRSNLAISVDDRTKDGADSSILNQKLSKFLLPQVHNATESLGEISLVTTMVIAGEIDTNNMSYDNTAEIIQYTSQTGRVTNLTTTIGNALLNTNGNLDEPDTDTTERVSLSPPTGLYTLRYKLELYKKPIIIVISSIAIIAIIFVMIKLKKKIGKIKKVYK